MAMPNCCLVSHLSPLSLHKHCYEFTSESTLGEKQYKLYNHRPLQPLKLAYAFGGHSDRGKCPIEIWDLCVMWSNDCFINISILPQNISPQKKVSISIAFWVPLCFRVWVPGFPNIVQVTLFCLAGKNPQFSRLRSVENKIAYLIQSMQGRPPTSYKWSYNPIKLPYKWVTGVSGVTTLLITGLGAHLAGLAYENLHVSYWLFKKVG